MKQCMTNEVLNGTLCFRIFKKRVFDISFPNLAFLSKCYCAGSCNLYFRMTGLLRFNDKFELFVFLKIYFIILDLFWKGTNIAQKNFFGRQRNRLCDDCFLIWSFQLWATFGWTTQSSTSSDKNGWIHFVFLQLIFGLLSNVDRYETNRMTRKKTLYLSHNMIRYLYLFPCGK